MLEKHVKQELKKVLLNETRVTFRAGFAFASLLYTGFWLVAVVESCVDMTLSVERSSI
jgi:hypothetical protein